MEQYYFTLVKYEPKVETQIVESARKHNSLADATTPNGDRRSPSFGYSERLPDADVLHGMVERAFMFGEKSNLHGFIDEIVDMPEVYSVFVKPRR